MVSTRGDNASTGTLRVHKISVDIAPVGAQPFILRVYLATGTQFARVLSCTAARDILPDDDPCQQAIESAVNVQTSNTHDFAFEWCMLACLLACLDAANAFPEQMQKAVGKAGTSHQSCKRRSR